jgi:gentisate 1,2-dioxygenase
VATKTWAHTPGGADPCLLLFDEDTGELRAVIEAFVLGQLRTAGTVALATDLLARPDARRLAVIGPGKQALAQAAAVLQIEDEAWPPVIIRAAELAEEAERLSRLPRPAHGRRTSWIAHPWAEAPGLGLAPGIRVSLDVLLPGEKTTTIRHNCTQVCVCIEGIGCSTVGSEKIPFSQYDVWLTPSLTMYVHENDSDERQIRLTYSNAPLLEKLKVHFVDLEKAGSAPARAAGSDEDEEEEEEEEEEPHPVAHVFPLGKDGPLLMSYERLINPPLVEQSPFHWKWTDVKTELDKLMGLGPSYRGRRLYLLYNPATGRTNRTTNSFFATMTVRPPEIVDRPHRHASAAINYFFSAAATAVSPATATNGPVVTSC